MINKNTPIPIYYQLQEKLRNMIESGELKPGDPVASEREMSEKYEISRMTVRQALTNLVNEGLLTRAKGRGTFVAEEKIEQPLMKLTGFSEDMRSRGIEPGSKLISFDTVEANPNTAKHLGIEPGTDVYQICRLRLGDGKPMAYEISYILRDRLPEMSEKQLEKSLYDYIEQQLGLEIERARQTIEPSFATEREAELLTIEPGAPILLLERTTYLSDGSTIEFAKSVYRGDRYKFIADMKRQR